MFVNKKDVRKNRTAVKFSLTTDIVPRPAQSGKIKHRHRSPLYIGNYLLSLPAAAVLLLDLRNLLSKEGLIR